NRRQEAVKAYAATQAENNSLCGSISFDSFLPSVLLWLVVIVSVVGVGVTVVVIVAAVTFPSILRGKPPIKASKSFSMSSSRTVFLLGLLVFAIVAACASRAAVTLSATNFLMAA
nr:hypothetical protein [Tanacetum cinerariifolium]